MSLTMFDSRLAVQTAGGLLGAHLSQMFAVDPPAEPLLDISRSAAPVRRRQELSRDSSTHQLAEHTCRSELGFMSYTYIYIWLTSF